MSKKVNISILAAIIIILATFAIVRLTATAVGHVEVVKGFTEPLEMPEGVAMDKSGNIYFTLGPPGFVGGGLGEVWKLSPDGTETMIVKYEFPGVSGPAGLAVDAPGNVYFAFPSSDPNYNGVYMYTGTGEPERIPGTEGMIVANGLAFDKQGILYASDSIMGALWRIPIDGGEPPSIWVQDTTLAGCLPDLPDAPIGANGVAYWKGSFYVANTARGTLVNIPILADGSAGMPTIVAGTDECDAAMDGLDAMDGIALDVKGNVYAVLVMQDKLVKIDPTDGSYETLLTADDGLWNPASVAFGTGKSTRKSLFIANYGVFNPPPNNLGPAILKVFIGEAGQPLP